MIRRPATTEHDSQEGSSPPPEWTTRKPRRRLSDTLGERNHEKKTQGMLRGLLQEYLQKVGRQRSKRGTRPEQKEGCHLLPSTSVGYISFRKRRVLCFHRTAAGERPDPPGKFLTLPSIVRKQVSYEPCRPSCFASPSSARQPISRKERRKRRAQI